MVANLAILGFFKYFDFFVTSAVALGRSLGVELHVSTLGILLPAGISFYTFQAMSYTIDIYRRHAAPTRSFSDFALFVCFFPHLVAGPIMRASTLLPQVVQPRHWKPGVAEEGLFLVAMGLFKKLVIADNLAPIANTIFGRFDAGQPAGLTGVDALIAVYAFAFQIYCDFSGYSAIARGVSKWLGFELVINFRRPYSAVSPSDFWRRWHISLSTWLRDYLYIPLGGNRGGTFATYRNLMLTMVLGGLWHGASWTFVAWGFYHGALLCVFRALGVSEEIAGGAPRARALRALRVVGMFHLVCAGWLLFRAGSFGGALAMATSIATDFRPSPTSLTALAFVAFHVLPLILLEWVTDGEDHVERLGRWPWPVEGLVYASLAAMLVLLRAPESHEFIYFQF
jgi:D-alanyl-lipoteichoic acid acyltransferase DltB (MBOAT superfamily)